MLESSSRIMASSNPTVEDFMVDSGIASTIELVLETAKQVGIATNQQLIPIKEEGIDVSGRERKDTLLKCEDKIREEIEKVFGKPIVNPIRDEKFCGNQLDFLPSSYTGVFLYYVLKGLYQDFGIWFDGIPVSLKNNRTIAKNKLQKTYNTGGRVLTNKQGKLLMEMADMKYYSSNIMSGAMTIEEAAQKVAETYAKIKEYADLGIVLPDKATGKVRYFNEEVEARKDKSLPDDRFKVYKEQGFEIMVPRLQEDYDMKVNHHKKYATSIKNYAGQAWFPEVWNTRDDNNVVDSGDIYKQYPYLVDVAKESFGVLGKDFKIYNTHIVKKRGKGKMRIMVFDCDTKKGEQFLLTTDGGTIFGYVGQPTIS